MMCKKRHVRKKLYQQTNIIKFYEEMKSKSNDDCNSNNNHIKGK